MPTSRPRHTITENDELSSALDDAAERWPEDRHSRARLLLHLAREGHRALKEQDLARENRRRGAVRRTSGALTGAYETGYLDRLRGEWPQ
jgi:hypothetical protein